MAARDTNPSGRPLKGTGTRLCALAPAGFRTGFLSLEDIRFLSLGRRRE